MGSKGGGSSSSTNSYSSGTSTTTLPDWLTTAAQNTLSAGEALVAKPYEAYSGQLVADPTAATNQAYSQINAMQGMGMPQWNADINAYGGMLGQVAPQTAGQIQGLTNQLYGGYGANVMAPATGLLGNYMQGTNAANQIGANAMALMSPYEQAVINPSMQAGQQALAQNLQQIGASANQAGAFGGSRQGVLEGVAQSQAALGESQQIANLLNSGWQASLSPATTAESQGYGAANTLAGMLQQGYGNAQQLGQGIAGTNLQAGLTSASQLQNALAGQQAAYTGQTNLLGQAGTAQQQQAQNVLDSAYGQWQEAQYYPYQQLGTMTSLLDSLPYGSTTTSSGYNMGNSNTSNTPSWGSTAGTIGGLVATGFAI